MRFGGVLPPDAPDPRDEYAARLGSYPFAVMGLRPQPHFEDRGTLAFTEGADSAGPTERSVSVTYTVWRNPARRDDPVNLAELDEHTRAALDTEPPWPRPSWLIEQAQQFRYPMAWEAVRTSWHRDQYPETSLDAQLLAHTNHILMNQFRNELGLPPGPTTTTDWRVTAANVNPEATLLIDGTPRSAVEIDTDPFVYAIGARLHDDVVTTVVLSREYLPLVDLALTTRPHPPAAAPR